MKQQHPPRLAEKLFNWYCGMAKADDLRGDLEELFYKNLKNNSAFRAKMIYWKQVISLISSYAMRKRKKDSRFGQYASGSSSIAMLQNYIKVATRSLYKHKYFSIVNSTGLAIGMSVSLLFITLFMYVCTYDNFHENRSTIYRVITSQNTARAWEVAAAPASIAENFNRGFSGLKSTVRINSYFAAEVISGKLEIPLRGYYTEPSFLSVFTYPLLKGNATTALVKPNSILLSEAAALKLFNSTDVLGKILEIKDGAAFEVTGILANPPKNSHMEFEALVSYSTLPLSEQVYDGDFKDWRSYGRQYVYLLLTDKAVIPGIEKNLNRLSQEASKRSGTKVNFHLQALSDITPGKSLSVFSGGLGPQWDTPGFMVFGIICFLILLPACFNYTNISIARALRRSKEIGLRKTMGGLKNQIFFQFISETVVITFISLIGGLLIFFFVRTEFKNMMVKGTMLDLSLTWQIGIAFLAFALFTGFIAGFFPALHFAGLNPVQAIKNQSAKRSSGNRIRKGLTIFQFALSFCFIVALVVFNRQYQYSLHYDFGFRQKGILDVDLQDVDSEKFRNEFSKLASVNTISMSSNVLGLSYLQVQATSVESRDSFEVAEIFVDYNYLDNFKLNLLAGRNFPYEALQNEKHIIVNEEFFKLYKLGNPQDALGKLFIIEGKELEIIGVLKNFHYASLNQPIEALLFRADPQRFTVANLSVNFTDLYSSLSTMEASWNILNPDKKFEARFFDDEIRESYDFYETLLKLVGFLGLLALSISLLGLLGMVVYTSENRTKEVGIRKVMGASTSGITFLLSKDYLKLMLWAAVFAIPIVILIADTILSGMQHYHVTLNFWDIALSLLILLIMGLSTIASQTFKTASTNPAETLRAE